MGLGKGKKRTKGKTILLSAFLSDEQPAAPGYTSRHVDWAETMENEDCEAEKNAPMDIKKIVLPTAPKAARGPDVDVSEIPDTPPFTAYVGNLPYEVTEDDICGFFAKIKLEVCSVRIPRESGDRNRMRGFGYAEFPNKSSLIEALSMNNESLKNRSIKVSLATEHVENERMGRGGTEDRVDRTVGDWRSGPRDDPSSNFRNNDRYGESDRPSYNRDRDQGGSDRDNDRKWRDGDRQMSSYDRNRGGGFDRGNDRSRREFGSGYQDSSMRSSFDNFNRDRREDYGSDRRGEDFGRNRRFGSDDRAPERRWGHDERRGGDDMGRDRRGGEEYGRDRGGGGYSRTETPQDSDRPQGEEKARPKLQLKPRSVPIEKVAEPAPLSAPTASAIFGGAKPVDTAAKEREIEERLAREKEQKRIILERKVDPPPARSRPPSETGGNTNYRSSCSEDDSAPPQKPKSGRQASSIGSIESDQDNRRENRPIMARQQDSNREYRNRDDNERSVRNERPTTRKANGDLGHHLKDTAYLETQEPVVYTSINKFSHLSAEDDNLDENISD